MLTYFPIAVAPQVARIPILFICNIYFVKAFLNFYYVYIENFNYLPNDQYCYVKSLTCFNFLFQAFDEKIAIELNLIGEADIKVDSEEFCNTNNDQPNNDGNR